MLTRFLHWLRGIPVTKVVCRECGKKVVQFDAIEDKGGYVCYKCAWKWIKEKKKEVTGTREVCCHKCGKLLDPEFPWVELEICRNLGQPTKSHWFCSQECSEAYLKSWCRENDKVSILLGEQEVGK